MSHPTALLYEKWQSPIRPGGAVHLTKASTAITKGRLVSIDSSGFVVHASSNDRVLGIALEAKAASDTSTAPILIDFVHKSDVLRGTADDVVAQTNVGESPDIKADGTVDVGVTSNGDFNTVNIMGTAATDILVTLNKTYF